METYQSNMIIELSKEYDKKDLTDPIIIRKWKMLFNLYNKKNGTYIEEVCGMVLIITNNGGVEKIMVLEQPKPPCFYFITSLEI